MIYSYCQAIIKGYGPDIFSSGFDLRLTIEIGEKSRFTFHRLVDLNMICMVQDGLNISGFAESRLKIG